jgi:hypothetical protein
VPGEKKGAKKPAWFLSLHDWATFSMEYKAIPIKAATVNSQTGPKDQNSLCPG